MLRGDIEFLLKKWPPPGNRKTVDNASKQGLHVKYNFKKLKINDHCSSIRLCCLGVQLHFDSKKLLYECAMFLCVSVKLLHDRVKLLCNRLQFLCDTVKLLCHCWRLLCHRVKLLCVSLKLLLIVGSCSVTV